MLLSYAAIMISRWDDQIDRQYAFGRGGSIQILFRHYGQIGKIYDVHLFQWLVGSLALGTLLYGKIMREQRQVELVDKIFRAMLVNSLITSSIKLLVGRQRPYTGAGPDDFELLDFYFNADAWSFPSGHTSSAFTLATVLAYSAENHLLKATGFFLAGSVGFQRILERKHWASDVLSGALLGYLCGRWIARPESSEKSQVFFHPFVHGKGVGVSISF